MGDLLEAAECGDLEALEALLSRSPSLIGESNEMGWTALHRAAQFGQTDIVSFLLENGAKVDARDRRGHTPLHDAAMGYEDHIPSMLLLLRHGARREAKNTYGQTPLMVAAQYSNSYGVICLLGAGAKSTARDRKGQTAADLAKHQLDGLDVRKYARQRKEIKIILGVLNWLG